MPRKAKPKRKGGRPTLYDPRTFPIVARCAMRAGHTMEELAALLNVNTDTVYEWQRRHKEFSEALKEGKAYADGMVEDSLFRRALGYETKETVTELSEGTGEGKGGGAKQRRVVREIKKSVAPDVTACIFWLKNRRPDRWREKQDHALVSPDGKPLHIEIRGVSLGDL